MNSSYDFSIPLWQRCAEAGMQAHLLGDLEGAEQNFRLSMKLAEHVFGRCHENVAETVITLADFLMSRQHYIEADELYHRALEIYDELLGPENFISTTILRVLAEIYNMQETKTQTILLHHFMLKVAESNNGDTRRHAS